jgi:hypothetical protein
MGEAPIVFLAGALIASWASATTGAANSAAVVARIAALRNIGKTVGAA